MSQLCFYYTNPLIKKKTKKKHLLCCPNKKKNKRQTSLFPTFSPLPFLQDSTLAIWLFLSSNGKKLRRATKKKQKKKAEKEFIGKCKHQRSVIYQR
jgi:hypothetical protein